MNDKTGFPQAHRAEYGKLSHDQLIELLLQRDEEIVLGKAFAQVTDTGTSDAALMWQGRNRFLSERVIPVQLNISDEDTFQDELNTAGHRIIAGDNLSVMASLLSDYRGGQNSGVDVIYFDPPYNTGSDTFAYSDSYSFTPAQVRELKRRAKQTEKTVSLDDPSRHTKWINHITPRLWQAKKLLKNTGVIIISIDEHELPRLWLLMEEMFGERNRLATIVWERSRKNDAKYISEGHEYMLVWARDKVALDATAKSKGDWRKRKDGSEEIIMAYTEAKVLHGHDLDSIRKSMDDFFKNLPKDSPSKKSRFKKVDKRGMYRDDGNLNWPGAGGKKYDVIHPVTKQPCKTPSSGWRYANPDDLQKLIDDKRINFGRDHNRIPSLITYLHEQEYDVQTSIIQRAGQASVLLLDNIIGKGVFTNPKDYTILAELFALVTWRSPNAVFLDAYAGSGTTAHAVIELNAEDGGNRRFILIENGDPNAVKQGKVTSRESYTAELTAGRVRRVISGQWADGKPHPAHRTGFTFYNATKPIDRGVIMDATREVLADIILQVVEEDSNRIDCRIQGHKYLIGRTKTGYGIALVWQGKSDKTIQPLTMDTVDDILDEAKAAGVTRPVFIYAVANIAPIADDLYRFQHIPNSILARLSLLPGDGTDD